MSPPDDDERTIVLKAVYQKSLVGFACVLPDADPSWGAVAAAQLRSRWKSPRTPVASA